VSAINDVEQTGLKRQSDAAPGHRDHQPVKQPMGCPGHLIEQGTPGRRRVGVRRVHSHEQSRQHQAQDQHATYHVAPQRLKLHHVAVRKLRHDQRAERQRRNDQCGEQPMQCHQHGVIAGYLRHFHSP
jgi:hypothetical protein